MQCHGGGGGGGRRGTGHPPFPPPPPDFFFSSPFLFICFTFLFFFLSFFFYIYFYFFPFFIFLFFACQLRAQSCTLMMIIPLTHYDNLATNYFQVGGKMCHSPLPSPPFFFCLSAKRSILYVDDDNTPTPL